MFIKLSTEVRGGTIEPRLVAVDDIGLVRPANKTDAMAQTCIALKSNPDFPVWAIESFEAVEELLLNLED